MHIGHELEILVSEIFSKYGFKTDRQGHKKIHYYDVHAEINGAQFGIEVKYSRNNSFPTNRLSASMIKLKRDCLSSGIIPIIVIVNVVSEEQITRLEGSGSYCESDKLIIVDLQNLIYLIRDDENLKGRLMELLTFSVEEILPIKPEKLFLNNLNVPDRRESLKQNYLQSFKKWDPGSTSSSEYERLCVDALKYLFNDDLAIWEVQQKSNDDLYRFDLICKIKDRNNKEFWNMLENYFNTKYIIFEFKNYNEQITQKEIYTTEKYLYAKALRRVAIIISPSGAVENAQKACSGILRENGKLIINLNHCDMVKMLESKQQNESASEHLCELLDKKLIELEK